MKLYLTTSDESGQQYEIDCPFCVQYSDTELLQEFRERAEGLFSEFEPNRLTGEYDFERTKKDDQ